MKNLYDIMDETDKPIKEFREACQRLGDVKFVVADKNISQLLKLIASSKVLYSVIKCCTEGFDFAGFLRKIKREVNGKKVLKLDNQPRKSQIAFVFSLLYSFDTKELDMHKFIHTYFFDENINIEFANFCKQIINVFCDNIISEIAGEKDDFIRQVGRKREKEEVRNLQIFKQGGDVGESLSKDLLQEFDDLSSKELAVYQKKVDYRFADNEDDEGYIDDLQAESLTALCREIVSIITLEQKIDPKEKEEMLMICESFEKALDFGGLNSVKIMLIALKFALKASSISRSLAVQIQSLLAYANEYNL